jgi:hypothetical protein
MVQELEKIEPIVEPTSATVWARSNRIKETVFREKLTESGMFTGKFMQGYIQSAIAGDDENAFRPAMLMQEATQGFHEQSAMQSHADILERLDWEANLPEAPIELRQKILEVSDQLKFRKFTDDASFQHGYHLWEGLSSWVAAESESNPEWLLAKVTYEKHLGYLEKKYGAEIIERMKTLAAA